MIFIHSFFEKLDFYLFFSENSGGWVNAIFLRLGNFFLR